MKRATHPGNATDVTGGFVLLFARAREQLMISSVASVAPPAATA
jgi:hypothetical protein